MIDPIKVSATEDGIRIMRWFGRHYPWVTQGEFHKFCRTGQIRINAGRCRGNEVLYEGDIIRIPPFVLAASGRTHKKTGSGAQFSMSDLERLRKRIIHDDEDIVVFDKPAGLAVQGGSGIKKSLDKMAAAMFPHDTVLLVHRLDKETSGVLVVAKNQRAAQALAAEFQEQTAHKEYLALLSGPVARKSGTIDTMMAKGRVFKDAEEAAAFAVETSVKPQRAVTKYKVLGAVDDAVTFVRFFPLTGRTHQLRLHAAFALDAPIVGDNLYGTRRTPGNNVLSGLIGGNNLFLFARSISFRHPGTGKQMTLAAEMPRFMENVVKFLGFNVE